MKDGIDLENGSALNVEHAASNSEKIGASASGKTLEKLESAMSVRENPFADRESKSLTWRSINMILVRNSLVLSHTMLFVYKVYLLILNNFMLSNDNK